ncbi:MAG: MFS transporter [Betaproteobacteria bacterium]|nr:MFS transporter [Betaproteobacteria bacterium]
MSARELRASFSLASIFGLRLFGMFIILPVFALYAEHLPGWNLTLVGIALGAYGLTQAILQIPCGWASDRLGRKPVMVAGLLVFALGSAICAFARDPWAVILGRTIQGAGAISGVAIAMAGDLTRPSQRTKAMAIIGSTIGVAFAGSFVAASSLRNAIGVPGIFALTGMLAVAAVAVVVWVVPDPPAVRHGHAPVPFAAVLRDPELARLNVGIFSLHAVLMATFVVVPHSLVRAGLPSAEHWVAYLGAVGAGFLIMLPFVTVRRIARHERAVFLGSVSLMTAGIAVLAASADRIWPLGAGLVIFFTAFNVLEAKLPALVSKAAPPSAKGAASGVYSSVQFFGTFVGGAAGGAIAQHFGPATVLVGCLALATVWLAIAWPMREPAAREAEPELDAPVPHEPQATNP